MSVFLQAQPNTVLFSPARILTLKPLAVSASNISCRDLQRISRATEQKYAEFTKNAMAVFPDKRLASIAVALSKIALLHDLSKHLATDATVAFDVLDAVSELTEETQAFLSTFLLEHGLPALLTEEISAYVRQEGAQAA